MVVAYIHEYNLIFFLILNQIWIKIYLFFFKRKKAGMMENNSWVLNSRFMYSKLKAATSQPNSGKLHVNISELTEEKKNRSKFGHF